MGEYVRELLRALWQIRDDLRAETQPTGDDFAEHWTYLWHQALAVMLTVRFWVFAAAISLVAAVVQVATGFGA